MPVFYNVKMWLKKEEICMLRQIAKGMFVAVVASGFFASLAQGGVKVSLDPDWKFTKDGDKKIAGDQVGLDDAGWVTVR